MENELVEKAQQFLAENKVKRIKSDIEKMFEIESSTEENLKYLVLLPDFCTCTHFLFTCLKEKDRVCKHILAASMAGEVPVIENENWMLLLNIQD